MILTGPEIVRLVLLTKRYKAEGRLKEILSGPSADGYIDITPFDESKAGPNSYDVHLGGTLKVYTGHQLDPRKANPTRDCQIFPQGFLLIPGTLYLGTTVERTMTTGLVPDLDGCSTNGRLGVAIHVTAGRGDVGFGEGCPDGIGTAWTLEIRVVHDMPVWVFPGMRIGQLYYSTVRGEVKPYRGVYGTQQGPTAAIPH